MSRTLRRGALAATTLALALAGLTACASGHDAQTSEVKPDNAAARVGDIEVQNAVIIAPAREGDPAAVSARIFNNGDRAETLDRVTIQGTGTTVDLSGAEGGSAVSVPAGGSVLLGGEGNPAATVADPAGMTAGRAGKLVFDFSRTGTVRLSTTVVPASGQYADYAGTAAPSPSPSDTAGSASPGASASPTEGSASEQGSPSAAVQ